MPVDVLHKVSQKFRCIYVYLAIFRIYCFWKDKNGAKKGKFANCARPSRFSPIKSVYLQTLSKYHPKIVRRKRKGQETRIGTTFIQANITLSTLAGFNLLVAIKANCKQTTQVSYFVILNIA